MIRAALVLAACAACGDGVPAEPTREPEAGARLVPMWFGYADGARQLRRDEVFDLAEEAPCRPLRWSDGALRCTPAAEEAVYADDGCTRVVGRTRGGPKPTHFVGRDRIDGVLQPVRLYRAGEMVAPLNVLWERRDGVCVGPFSAAGGLTHYAVEAEVPLASLAVIDEDDGAGERLSLRTWRSDDGLWMPFGVHDQALATACEPTVEPDGRVRCHPLGATATHDFADPTCTEPVVIARTRPTIEVVEVSGDDGCVHYYHLGEERTGPAFVRTIGGCFAKVIPVGSTVFAVGEPVDLALLDRTVEDEPWRRLQRITLTAGGVRLADDRMRDTGLREDCRPVEVGGVLRCLPEVVATSTTAMFGSESCLVPADVAIFPQPTCRRARFARGADAEAGALQLVGAPRTADLFDLLFGRCQVRTPVAGQAIHDLGPVIDPSLFVGAVLFGDR